MKRDNELLNAIKRYFSSKEGTSIYYYGTGFTAIEFADIFQSGEKRVMDAPDMLVRKDNIALIIEHFEFDSYRVTRKGSQNRREQSRIEGAEKERLLAGGESCFSDEIHGSSSYQNYIQNVSRSFAEHYRQINTYKKNLKARGFISDSQVVRVLFFIEDTSPLGSVAADQSEGDLFVRPISLGQCQEFLSLLQDSPDVNYVLACSTVGPDKIVWFIDRNEIFEYQKNAIDYSQMQFINFEPQVSGFQIQCPLRATAEGINAEIPKTLMN